MLIARIFKARERGDTIVEVLISIAVVSMILGGAYVVSNSSLQATRSAEEHGTALKIAESQLEQVKSLAAVNPATIFGGAVPIKFCIYTDPSTGVTSVLNSSNTKCTVGATQPQYTIAVTRTANTFALQESWPDVNGKIIDHLQLTYRVYP